MTDTRSLRAAMDNLSVLTSGDCELRAKLIIHEQHGTWLHIKAQLPGTGLFVHVLFDEDAALMAMTTGKADSDAWTRLRSDMARRGFDID
jgi:hypothetical protein